jgi:hypothetical protein
MPVTTAKPAGGGVTVTTTDCGALVPPIPVQVSVNVALAVSGPTSSDPDAARVPVQPSLAAQLVASVADHVSVVELGAATVVADALKETVGVPTTVIVTD